MQHCFAKMKTNVVILSSNTEVEEIENYSFTLMPCLTPSKVEDVTKVV